MKFYLRSAGDLLVEVDPLTHRLATERLLKLTVRGPISVSTCWVGIECNGQFTPYQTLALFNDGYEFVELGCWQWGELEEALDGHERVLLTVDCEPDSGLELGWLRAGNPGQ